MMGKRVGLLAGLLVLALGSGVVAQEPSPPPWLGGRVEMPEHGFAVTLPDDWVGFDPSADVTSQLEAAADFIDPVAWAVDYPGFVDRVAFAASEGFQLWSVNATSTTWCAMGAARVPDMSLDEAADRLFEEYDHDPRVLDIEPPQPIDLPAGPAYVTRMSWAHFPDIDARPSMSIYLLGTDEVGLAVMCTTVDARPDDDSLSIAETFEFLPAEE